MHYFYQTFNNIHKHLVIMKTASLTSLCEKNGLAFLKCGKEELTTHSTNYIYKLLLERCTFKAFKILVTKLI